MKAKFYIILLLVSTLILYFSCAEQKDPFSVSTHPDGWKNAQSSNFHGKMVLESYANAANCQSCHGVDFSGGTSNISCSAEGCHNLYPHLPGIADSLSDNFHSKAISNTYNWDITICKTCHGSNYDGEGYNKKNCRTCHSQPDGPEACNTCHGNFHTSSSDTLSWAPSEDLAGNYSTTNIGVGAHRQHLTNVNITLPLKCIDCHSLPANFEDPIHIDGNLPAEIVFGDLATTFSDSAANPTWSNSQEICSNVFCHGEFKNGNKKQSIIWTSVGTGQAACNTCHGLPPGGTHDIYPGNCNNCHFTVVSADTTINNLNKHLNGEIDVYGNVWSW